MLCLIINKCQFFILNTSITNNPIHQSDIYIFRYILRYSISHSVLQRRLSAVNQCHNELHPRCCGGPRSTSDFNSKKVSFIYFAPVLLYKNSGKSTTAFQCLLFSSAVFCCKCFIYTTLTILTGKNCVLLSSVQEWLLSCF